jgi:hypothetical protein
MVYLIREILVDKNGDSIGIVSIGRFSQVEDRDKAYDEFFIENNRKALRGEEQ